MLEKIANPQGKGMVGVSDDLRACTPMHVCAKSFAQWLADYFSSSLVLNAHFKFKPVVGNNYYLYLKNKQWKLSLIEPVAWLEHDAGIFFACCMLHSDMSWSVEPRDDWQDQSLLHNAVMQLQQVFLQSLDNESSISKQLPFYLAQLPYYQRLGANALARSLKLSLELKLGNNACTQLSGKHLLEKLKNSDVQLLGCDIE